MTAAHLSAAFDRIDAFLAVQAPVSTGNLEPVLRLQESVDIDDDARGVLRERIAALGYDAATGGIALGVILGLMAAREAGQGELAREGQARRRHRAGGRARGLGARRRPGRPNVLRGFHGWRTCARGATMSSPRTPPASPTTEGAAMAAAAGHRPPRAATDESTIGHLHDAMADLEEARVHAGADVRRVLDIVIDRLRETAGDLRSRTEEQIEAWQRALDEAPEDIRRELGRRAIHAQRSPQALTALSAEIRKRRAELFR